MAELQESDLPIIKSFRGNGYKATPQRIAISRFALSNHDHPTAQRIYSEVKKMYPTVSLATVYKTIQILKEIGMVQEMKLLQGQTRFDPNMEPHAHLICLRCGNISDWINPLVPEIMERISDEVRFIPEEQNFDIYGVCQACDRKEKLATLKVAIAEKPEGERTSKRRRRGNIQSYGSESTPASLARS